MRQEFIDPIGVVASFTRGCEESPDFLNHEVVDPTFKTYYRACTNDLCNIGNGIQSVVGGSLSPTPEYSGVNLLVPVDVWILSQDPAMEQRQPTPIQA
ncbi:hypothetical protein RR48_12875 [Papilio machaon]|uniref:Uncharacterized protein n=1 Tax=Papilio machaon TaxID=76193 RepID=A0A194QX36_PAPMA|nr:hypothetical protein RR48_12875 [Papilio machaon]